MTQQAPPPPGAPFHPQGGPVPPSYGAPAGPGMPAGYGMPPGHGAAPAPARTNGLAIGALVAAFLVPLVGLILGIVARGQIRRSGEGGRGLATAAIWVSSVLIALGVLAVVAVGVTAANLPPTASAQTVATEIASKAGLPPGSVTCPGPLEGTVGTKMTCTGTTPEGPASFVTTVTSAQDDTVAFDIAQQ